MDIIQSIKEKLNEIERTENVHIIMAVESGSRSWGFESPDSDYDVRFIYVRRTEDYLKLVPVRDVIEWQLDDVYDISGWDLKKALLLLYESNPTMHEWCKSPIVYKESQLAQPLRELTRECFLPKKLLYHYVSMAENNYRTHLTGEKVRLKKYFYALRPVLAAHWVVEDQSAPPMLFEDLVDAKLPPKLLPIVQKLLKQKRQTSELGSGEHIPELDAYIHGEIEILKQLAAQQENRKNDWAKLDAFFQSAVLESGQ